MANLPTQPYNRFQGWGEGIGSIIAGILSANRQREVAEFARDNPDAPVEQLLGKYPGDPGVRDLVSSIMQGRMQKIQTLELSRRAEKDVAEANRANAGGILDMAKTLTEQMNQRLEPLKQRLTEAEINEKNSAASKNVAEANKWNVEQQKLKAEIVQIQATQPLIDSLLKNFTPMVSGPTPDTLDQATEPAPSATGTGSSTTTGRPQAQPTRPGASLTGPTPTPQTAGYPEGSPDPVQPIFDAASKLRNFQKSPQGQGVNLGLRVGPLNVTQSHDKVTPQETDRLDALHGLTQTLGAVGDALARDKDGKLKLGPLGILNRARAKYFASGEDPNALLGVLSGHTDITVGSLLPGNRSGGVRMLEFLKEIVVNPSRSKSFNVDAMENSLRLVANEAAGMATNQLGRRALGTDPDTYEDIGRIIKQTYSRGYFTGGDVTIGQTTIKGADIDRMAKGENKTREQIIQQLNKELGGGGAP